MPLPPTPTPPDTGLARLRHETLLLEPAIRPLAVRTVLEFGCGDCALLAELQARGYDVTGYEPASEAQRAGDAVAVYPYWDAQLPGIPAGEYDVVIAVGSLDRLRDEATAERALRELFRVAARAVVVAARVPGRLAQDWPFAAIALGHVERAWPLLSERRRGDAKAVLIGKS